MPIYEYICKKCTEGFSLFQRVGTTERDTMCPRCGSRDIKKKISTFNSSCSVDSKFSSPGSHSGFSGGS
jgi:putative FmdB family regulatory protein